MSDSDDSGGDIPPREECEERCQAFATVTGTDTALAMFYLQDRAWDLQRSLDAYFEDNPVSSGTSSVSSGATVQPAASSDNSKSVPAPPPCDDDPAPHRLRILSWNIDGLDTCNLVSRTKGACKTILEEHPDVVFLQEVVAQSQEIIEQLCPTYQFIPGIADARQAEAYYTAMLLKVTNTVYEEHNVQQFFSSMMGRTLLKVKAKVKKVPLLLMTSHLESTKSHDTERKRQLQAAFKVIQEAEGGRTVLFGGDLNIRDKEIDEVGGLPPKVLDIWEVTGKRPEAKFTWDTMRNDNLEWSGKFKPRCRFDRLYLRHCDAPHKLKPVYFELVGIQRLQSCKRFPSDHWGILSHYDLL